MQNLTTQQVVDFFKAVKSVDKDGDGGYTDQPWFKLPDLTEGWIPVELDICYSDQEDQMLMAEIASKAPELHPFLARNPHIYPDLLNWLASLNDSAINAAIRLRR